MQRQLKKSPQLSLIQIQVRAEMELRRLAKAVDVVAPEHWRDWLITMFPRYVSAPFAPRHVEFWEWTDAVTPASAPDPFVAIWPRGGAKSTSAELGVTYLGATGKRRYCWYISSTQDKADGHVDTIAALMESDEIDRYYPKMAERKLGKYGNSKGWRRSRLRTASGFTVDSLGLDTGARGVKVEDQRPDLIVLDDVDELHDSFSTTQKKMETITKSVLPAGANGNTAVLFIQNLITPESIASRLADGRAEFLASRRVSGPFPAIDGLAFEQRDGRFFITAGRPTWEGQNLAICQEQINLWGISAFLQEAQHDVERTGGIWDHIEFQHIEWDALPDMVRTVVWIDPAVTSNDGSDCQGVSAGGIDPRGTVYNLYAWEGIESPESAMERAIRKGIELEAQHVGVETDQGGDTWESVYKVASEKVQNDMRSEWLTAHPDKRIEDMPPFRIPPFTSDKVSRLRNDAGQGSDSRSKMARNQLMLSEGYEHGKVVHVVGTHNVLEKSLRRFPNKPLDLADSWWWCWADLTERRTVGAWGRR
jgi:hypothetical protein